MRTEGKLLTPLSLTELKLQRSMANYPTERVEGATLGHPSSSTVSVLLSLSLNCSPPSFFWTTIGKKWARGDREQGKRDENKIHRLSYFFLLSF